MPYLKTRSTLPEKMDDPSVPEGEVIKAIREIEKINKWFGGNQVILNALSTIKWPDEPVKIMDLGCGGGDILRLIAKWAAKKHRDVRLIGVDLNPVMTRLASNRSIHHPGISFKTADVFDDTLEVEAPHIVTCSLFAHHFDKDELVVLLRRMTTLARNAVIINDPQRHWFAYHAIGLLTRLFRSPKMVQFDAPLSVARSLTRREWEEALNAAGVSGYSVHWRWAWRWEIIIEK